MDEPLDDPAEAGRDDRYPDRARDAGLVTAARSGDERAFGRLYDAWFDRVYGVALGVVRQPDVAAEVAQDAFLAAWRGLDGLDDPLAFGGWLLRIARNGALNRRAKEQRSSPVDDTAFAVIEATGASPTSAPTGFGVEDRLSRLDDPAAVAEQTELQQLLWSAVGALGERDAEVLDLQLRYGMSPAEIGEIIGVNRNAANQLVHRVRGRLETAVRARVLWRGERPACDTLADLLAAAGVAAFDADAVRIAERHAPSCSTCSERRDLHLQPAAMFAAVPLLAAPILFKQQVAGAMELAGVPMQGSSFAGSAGAGAIPPDPSSGSGSGGGSGSTGSGAGASHGDGDGSGPHRWSTRAKVLVMAVVAFVLIAGAIAVLAAETHEPVADLSASASTSSPPGSLAVLPETTSTTAPPATTTTASTTPPTTAGGPTTTAPPATSIAASLRLSTSSVPANGGPAPTLTWSVTGTGTYSVTVKGFTIEGGTTVPSAASSGSGLVCPGKIVRDNCIPSTRQSSYGYVLTVTAPDGTVLISRTVTLTVS